MPDHPNSKYSTEVTPVKRGKGQAYQENENKTPEQRHQAMTWAPRLKRVFNIEVSTCPKCGVEAKVVAPVPPAPATLEHPCTSLPV